jgi:4-hydroxy-2-oxoheptanedioate aldolase
MTVLAPDAVRRSRLGLIVKMPSAATVELAGHAGFDVVVIDTEHGPNGMSDLEHHILAASGVGVETLVRVSDISSPDILRALDAGADGIVVPHVCSASDAEQAVARTHYAPHGLRSLALSTRAGSHGLRSVDEHLAHAHQRVQLIAQIENAEAVDRLPEILSTEALHGVFIGPSDLSLSLGYPGQLTHPVVHDAIERTVEAVLASDLTLCVLAADEHEAQEWSVRGAGLVLLNAPSLMAARLQSISATVQTPVVKD